MQIKLGDMVQHPSGEIGMIVATNKYWDQPGYYDVEWYNPVGVPSVYTGYNISASNIREMRERYLNFRDWILHEC